MNPNKELQDLIKEVASYADFSLAPLNERQQKIFNNFVTKLEEYIDKVVVEGRLNELNKLSFYFGHVKYPDEKNLQAYLDKRNRHLQKSKLGEDN